MLGGVVGVIVGVIAANGDWPSPVMTTAGVWCVCGPCAGGHRLNIKVRLG